MQQLNEKSLNQGYLQEVTSHLCRGRRMDIQNQAKVMWASLIYSLFIVGFFSRKHKACATLSLSLSHTHTHTHTFISLSWLSHINKCPLTSFNPHSEWKMLLRNSEVGFFLPLIHLSWEKRAVLYVSRGGASWHTARVVTVHITSHWEKYRLPVRRQATEVFLPTGIQWEAASPERERKWETERRDPLLREHLLKTSTWPLCACIGVNVLLWVCASVCLLWVSVCTCTCVCYRMWSPPAQLAPRGLQGRVCYCEMV